MNMRQQRITTSQQEVYLIYLMEHTEFAASRIKDGDCCCFFLLSVLRTIFLCSFFENYVFETCSQSFVSLFSCLTGESKYEENWKELTKMLNNTLGPKKSVEEWKMVTSWFELRSSKFSWHLSHVKVFFNWKNQLRTRAKKLKQIQDGKTGADDKLALQKLTDVEKRALKLWKEDFQDKDIASVSSRL